MLVGYLLLATGRVSYILRRKTGRGGMWRAVEPVLLVDVHSDGIAAMSATPAMSVAPAMSAIPATAMADDRSVSLPS